jgi:hypothetical protein
MAVPLILEVIAILLDIVKKECVQKPNVVWIVLLKEVASF